MLPYSAQSVTGGSPPTIKKKKGKGKAVEGRMRSSSLALQATGQARSLPPFFPSSFGSTEKLHKVSCASKKV